jgi:hypothetical protein
MCVCVCYFDVRAFFTVYYPKQKCTIYIYINTLYIVSTPKCFDASASSSGSLNIVLILCSFTTHCSLKLIVRSELDVPTFATRRLHACHHVRRVVRRYLYNCNSLITSFPSYEVPNCRHTDSVHVPTYRTHYWQCKTLAVGTHNCRLQGRDFL